MRHSPVIAGPDPQSPDFLDEGRGLRVKPAMTERGDDMMKGGACDE